MAKALLSSADSRRRILDANAEMMPTFISEQNRRQPVSRVIQWKAFGGTDSSDVGQFRSPLYRGHVTGWDSESV